MTPEEIDSTPSGPEMDELIAEWVTGRESVTMIDVSSMRTFEQDASIPPYSTSAAAALEVLNLFPWFQVEKTGRDTFIVRISLVEWPSPDHPETVCAGFTLAQAICRAALKTMLAAGAVPQT